MCGMCDTKHKINIYFLTAINYYFFRCVVSVGKWGDGFDPKATWQARFFVCFFVLSRDGNCFLDPIRSCFCARARLF